MKLTLSNSGGQRPRRRQRDFPLSVESAESRCLPSGVGAIIALPVPHQTIDQSEGLGKLVSGHQVNVHGTIGDTPILGAQVDWYRFVLS